MMKKTDKIESLNELILALNNCSLNSTENSYLKTLRKTDIGREEWENHFLFNKIRPTRVCLSSTPEYDLLLSCWEKGQEGPIHDLNSEEAWIHPICGKFREERYRLTDNKPEQVSAVTLTTESYSFMQKSKTIFKYVNTYENRSVCLHLYAKPVSEWRQYNEETGKTVMVKNQFDAADHPNQAKE